MKTRLFLVGAALALGLGSGCATYTGGTADEDGVAYGSEYGFVDPHRDLMGTRAVPVWKQPSPSGHELGGTRPEIIWYR